MIRNAYNRLFKKTSKDIDIEYPGNESSEFQYDPKHKPKPKPQTQTKTFSNGNIELEFVSQSREGNKYPGYKNEDRVYTGYRDINIDNINKKVLLFAVFDGHGGDEVSTFCLDSISILFKILDEEPSMKVDVETGVNNSFNQFFEYLYTTLKENTETFNSNRCGSTAVIGIIIDNVVYVANAGDSKCIIIENNDTPIEVSTEHDACERYEQECNTTNSSLYQSGDIGYTNRCKTADNCNIWKQVNLDGSDEQTPPICRVSRSGLMMTRSVGDLAAYNECSKGSDPVFSYKPSLKTYTINEKTTFITVSSDGITDAITNDKLVQYFKDDEPITKKRDDLINDAYKWWYKDNDGIIDDISIIIFKVKLSVEPTSIDTPKPNDDNFDFGSAPNESLGGKTKKQTINKRRKTVKKSKKTVKRLRKTVKRLRKTFKK